VHDCIIYLSENVWPHKTRLTPPCFIEMPASSRERECLYISVLWVSVLTLSTIFLLDFETVPRVVLFSFYYVDYDLRQIILSAIKRCYFYSGFIPRLILLCCVYLPFHFILADFQLIALFISATKPSFALCHCIFDEMASSGNNRQHQRFILNQN
jgi:hypothetical protein